jgi:hypothetical protein
MTPADIGVALSALGSLTTAVVVLLRAIHEAQQTRRLQAQLAVQRDARDAGTIAGQARRIAELEAALVASEERERVSEDRARHLAEELTGRRHAHAAQASPRALPIPAAPPALPASIPTRKDPPR